MKKIAKIFGSILFACCYLFAAGNCGAVGGGYDGGYAGDYAGGVMEEGAGGEEAGLNSISEVVRPAGLITAGAWNDNDNYDMWKSLFAQAEDSSQEGKFYGYSSVENSWGFTSYNRIMVTVESGEEKVAGAKVAAKDSEGELLFAGVTNANGVAYLFTDTQEGIIEVQSGAGNSQTEFTAENRNLVVEIEEANAKKNIIELMFVVDVTGSMGDELSYLNNEIADVVDKVAVTDENTQINLALLFYRDHGDEKVFQYYDFVDVTTEDGLSEQQAAIAAQRADGGGDYAEAVDEALELAIEKQWSGGETTKILFMVLDAPPHEGTSNQTTLYSAVIEAAKKGVRICPVLCSGADTLTEYTMRQASIYTGGTFVFVTDDSGIGNEHYDPQLPNVTIEALNSLMVRLINGYHSGEFAEPIDWRQEVR